MKQEIIPRHEWCLQIGDIKKDPFLRHQLPITSEKSPGIERSSEDDMEGRLYPQRWPRTLGAEETQRRRLSRNPARSPKRLRVPAKLVRSFMNVSSASEITDSANLKWGRSLDWTPLHQPSLCCAQEWNKLIFYFPACVVIWMRSCFSN